jgi:hypothetical protein
MWLGIAHAVIATSRFALAFRMDVGGQCLAGVMFGSEVLEQPGVAFPTNLAEG